MGQGKRDSQMKDSENFAFWGIVCFIICILLLLLTSCSSLQLPETQEEKDYITINGEDVEFVIDDYENPYLKYTIDGKNIYIPFPFETEDSEPIYKGPIITKHERATVLFKNRIRVLPKRGEAPRKDLRASTL